jgi:hypothetical protein
VANRVAANVVVHPVMFCESKRGHSCVVLFHPSRRREIKAMEFHGYRAVVAHRQLDKWVTSESATVLDVGQRCPVCGRRDDSSPGIR